MGSDNSGKRAKASRLLVPAVAIVILVLGSIVFLMSETPNQVGAMRAWGRWSTQPKPRGRPRGSIEPAQPIDQGGRLIG